MTGPGRTGELSMALFLAGLVAFSPPLLFIFGSADATLLGIPLLYLYLFALWIGLIALTAVIAERARGEPTDGGRRADPPSPREPPHA